GAERRSCEEIRAPLVKRIDIPRERRVRFATPRRDDLREGALLAWRARSADEEGERVTDGVLVDRGRGACDQCVAGRRVRRQADVLRRPDTRVAMPTAASIFHALRASG